MNEVTRYWVWGYEPKRLGSFPGKLYKGHNTAIEIVLASDYDALLSRLIDTQELLKFEKQQHLETVAANYLNVKQQKAKR